MVLVFYSQYEWAAFVTLAAAATDAEGFYARRTGTETELGRVFDPLADKVFTDVLLVMLVFVTYSPLVLLLVLVTIGYDIDNTLRRLSEIVTACENRAQVKNDTPVTFVSKAKTSALFLTVLGLLLMQVYPAFGDVTLTVAFASLVLVLFSWGSNRKVLLQRLLSK